MYICKCICTYLYMFVCLHSGMHVYVYTCLYVCIYVLYACNVSMGLCQIKLHMYMPVCRVCALFSFQNMNIPV